MNTKRGSGRIEGQQKRENPESIAPIITRLSDDGLLEAYVLLVRADPGIKQDYPLYREANRDKLKRYLTQYVMKNGGM